MSPFWLMDGPSRMSKVTSGALPLSSHHVYTPLEKRSKTLFRTLFVQAPILLDERF